MSKPRMNEADQLVTVRGIADAHGIESMVGQEEQLVGVLRLRAQSNRHRHAVVYESVLPATLRDSLIRMVKAGMAPEALKLLKGHPEAMVRVERGWERSWDMIPNHELDPYWSPEKEEVKS